MNAAPLEPDAEPISSGVRRSLRALFVEADLKPLQQVEHCLRQAGFEPVLQHVRTAAALTSALERGRWDVVFSNPLLPGFDGVGPLGILRTRNLDLPCIVIMEQTDERRAAAILKAGARDVVWIDQLQRLPQIVQRELAHARLRRTHRKTVGALDAASTRLRTLVDAAPIAVVELDRNGHVVTWNGAAERISGWTPANVIGQALPMLSGEQDGALAAMCAEAVRGRSFAGVETRWMRAQGDTVELTTSLSAIADETGNLLLTATPRCEMVRLKRSLDQAQHNEAFGQLARGIAAEIAVPLQAIRGELGFITAAVEELASVVAAQREEAAPRERAGKRCADATPTPYDRIDADFLVSEIPRSLEKLRTAAVRAGQIVRAMGEVSPTATDDRRPCDLNRAVESTATVARSEFRHVADLVLDLQPELPPVVCVQNEISFVLLNLIVNAAHAVAAAAGGKGRGAITVSTGEADGHVVVTVNDTGTGIPARDQPRIFEPFFTTKPAGKGTGQGLARSKAIIEGLRGSISFESEEGVGTTFMVRLPCQRNVVAQHA